MRFLLKTLANAFIVSVASITFLSAPIASATPIVAENVVPSSFKAAVRYHLNSVETRDLETFKSTLTKSDDLYVIFPGGSLLESTTAVVDFHREWFKDKTWIFKTEIVKTIEGSTQSTALVKYSFQDNAEGAPRQAWLLLTFQLESGAWRLIHDQNTRIDE